MVSAVQQSKIETLLKLVELHLNLNFDLNVWFCLRLVVCNTRMNIYRVLSKYADTSKYYFLKRVKRTEEQGPSLSFSLSLSLSLQINISKSARDNCNHNYRQGLINNTLGSFRHMESTLLTSQTRTPSI